MQMYTGYWLGLSPEVKAKMRLYFNIAKSQGTHVETGMNGSHIISDGHTDTDLLAVTDVKMQELLDSKETDYMKLLEATVGHFKAEVEAEKQGVTKAEQAHQEAVKEEEAKAIGDVILSAATSVAERRAAGRPKKTK